MIFIFINILLFLKFLLGTTEEINFEDDFDISREKRAVLRDLTYRWNESIIYYKVQPNFNNKYYIQKALSDLTNNSCLQFQEINEDDNDTNKTGFYFYEGGVYKTNLGRNLDFGQFQNISLASKYSSYHQIYRWILYALGLDFEHNRPDRDNHVVVHTANISKEFLNFTKKKNESEVNTFGLGYDFKSVMSLNELEFQGYNGILTFERKNYNTTSNFVYNEKLTPNDKKLLNRHYCSWRCNPRIDCLYDGFQNWNNCSRCICPREYDGVYCQHPRVLGKEKCIFHDVNITTIKSDGFNTDLSYGCGFSITSPPGTVLAVQYIFRDDPQPNQAYGETGVAEIKFEKNKNEPGLIISNVKSNGSFYSEDHYIIILLQSTSNIRLRINFKPVYIENIAWEINSKRT